MSLPDVVAAQARRAAKRAGVPLSAWLVEVATAAAKLDEAQVALEEFQAIYGPPDPEAAKAMDAKLAAAGFGRAETPEGVRDAAGGYCSAAGTGRLTEIKKILNR